MSFNPNLKSDRESEFFEYVGEYLSKHRVYRSYKLKLFYLLLIPSSILLFLLPGNSIAYIVFAQTIGSLRNYLRMIRITENGMTTFGAENPNINRDSIPLILDILIAPMLFGTIFYYVSYGSYLQVILFLAYGCNYLFMHSICKRKLHSYIHPSINEYACDGYYLNEMRYYLSHTSSNEATDNPLKDTVTPFDTNDILYVNSMLGESYGILTEIYPAKSRKEWSDLPKESESDLTREELDSYLPRLRSNYRAYMEVGNEVQKRNMEEGYYLKDSKSMDYSLAKAAFPLGLNPNIRDRRGYNFLCTRNALSPLPGGDYHDSNALNILNIYGIDLLLICVILTSPIPDPSWLSQDGINCIYMDSREY